MTLILPQFRPDGPSGAALSRVDTDAGGETTGAGTNVVVRSLAMTALYREIDVVACGVINVLILGETGVGKDVLARTIHDRSRNSGGPFLRLNCAALPAELLESELFGYERGAFTGAHHQKQGLLLTAGRGTIFLDEIGELPPHLQAKLLQVLETREVLPLGATKPRRIEARVLAASNRDLEASAFAGTFRSDLYFRLAGYTAYIPPLRERREDILPLACAFLGRAAQASVRKPASIQDDAATRLLEYAWPGNVRELRNVVERAFVLSGGRGIDCVHLPSSTMAKKPRFPTTSDASEPPVTDLGPEELAERKRILSALAECGGNQSSAAALLGFSRSTLLNRLDAYRIRRPRKRPH